MRIKVISLCLSLVLTIISTYEYISVSVFIDISPTKALEYSFEKIEKKQSDKQLDDIYLLSDTTLKVSKLNKQFHYSLRTLYSFNLQDPIFRPPIS